MCMCAAWKRFLEGKLRASIDWKRDRTDFCLFLKTFYDRKGTKERQRTGESAPERASMEETIYDAGRRPSGRQFLLIAESGDDDQLGADGSGSGACSAEWYSEYHRCGHGVHGGRNPRYLSFTKTEG